MSHTDEVIPTAEMYELLDKNWSEHAGHIAKPRLFDLGREGRTLRVDLDRILGGQGRQDLVIIKPYSPTLEEQPIGNWTYGNRVYNVLLEIYSPTSRQQLYNLMQEIRRICHYKMHSSVGFQRVQFQSFEELYEENFNLWVSDVTVQFVNNAVLLEV